MKARLAEPVDAESICRIYNQGITERTATFETRHRTPDDIRSWFGGRHPIVVAEEERRLSPSPPPQPIATVSAIPASLSFPFMWMFPIAARGVGGIALSALLSEAEGAGFWKLLSRIFVENTASRAIVRSLGFREVGIYENHASLDGRWRDVVIVEKFLGTTDTQLKEPGTG